MHVILVCPAPPGSRLGNRITAQRWARVLRELGHTAAIAPRLPEEPFDVLVALHATKSKEAVLACRARHPERSVVVALTGTDLHRDIQHDKDASRVLDLADRLIVLYPGAERALPRRHRDKVSLVVQSSPPILRPARPRARTFDVAVIGHLRPEKDPFRTALAARLLPEESRVRVLHAGKALSEAMAEQAAAEARENPRYRWLGELPAGRARTLVGRAHVLCLTSEMEGGANVLSEAAAAGTPILASRIACTEGLLGAGHPGLFPFGDTEALARLLRRAETEEAFLRDLERRSRSLGRLLSPANEKAAWRDVLSRVAPRDRRGPAEAP